MLLVENVKRMRVGLMRDACAGWKLNKWFN